MAVTIGIDPHKASHTAVALDGDEAELARLKVRASAGQVAELLAWAAPFPDRRWAVESADGWGYLVSQQLLAAGEDVLDVPATLAAASSATPTAPAAATTTANAPRARPAAKPSGR